MCIPQKKIWKVITAKAILGRQEFGLTKHTGWKGYFSSLSVNRSGANIQRCTQQAHNKDAKMPTVKQGETNNLGAIYFEHTLSSKQICNNEHTNESIIKTLNWSISLKMRVLQTFRISRL